MNDRLRGWGVALLLGGMTVLATLFVVAPTALMMPSRDQTMVTLQRAFGFMRAGPAITVVLALLAILLTARAWRTHDRRGQRLAMVGLTLAIVAFAVLARVNFVERMFAPLESVQTVAGDAAPHVAPGDMVLGVQVGDRARAYPVSIVAYHHIVNDRLGNQPFAVTY